MFKSFTFRFRCFGSALQPQAQPIRLQVTSCRLDIERSAALRCAAMHRACRSEPAEVSKCNLQLATCNKSEKVKISYVYSIAQKINR